jgi:hypothetical protein
MLSCPDCGGEVEPTGQGQSICKLCGAELVQGGSSPSVVQDEALPPGQRLREAVREKIRAGMPLEMAVDSSCAEVLPEDYCPVDEEVSDDRPELQTCPTCGVLNDVDVCRCAKCDSPLHAAQQIDPSPQNSANQSSLEAPATSYTSMQFFRIGLVLLVVVGYLWFWGPNTFKNWLVRNWSVCMGIAVFVFF